MTEIKELKGANMDIDLIPNKKVSWKQDKCPWNIEEKKNVHKCAVKNISLCDYFAGIKEPDTIICKFSSNKNKNNLK
ncbi:Uncharacterised protein [uncultured archaeon]|nr:Uncharacterised protein [uncultured archaeon]